MADQAAAGGNRVNRVGLASGTAYELPRPAPAPQSARSQGPCQIKAATARAYLDAESMTLGAPVVGPFSEATSGLPSLAIA